ncbi:MAG: NUDIX domain-containing protein [Chitinispirillales bacterium]|jgi:NADH pyrophosphatase NudC (nudix superfamily)|nr:NUDIX domain-containing protein [Chitinispirillales bacterium]
MSNQDVFKYCPRCSKTARLADSRKIDCPNCGFKLYLNTAAAVAAMIFDADGRLMFIRRNHDPQKGLLDLPGGFVDFNEDGETALRREVFEELGINLETVEYYRSIPNVYNYAGVLYHTLDIFFTCRAKNQPSVKPNDEIMEIVYKFPKDVSEDEIAFDSMKKLIPNFPL